MRTLSHIFTFLCALLVTGLTHLAYTYSFTTGYGLHPALAAFGIALLAVCLYAFSHCMARVTDEEEEEFDITNSLNLDPVHYK